MRQTDNFGRSDFGREEMNGQSAHSPRQESTLNHLTFGKDEETQVKAMQIESRALLDSISKRNSETKEMINKMNSGRREVRYS